MRLCLIPACPRVQLSEKMRRQSQALRLSSSEIRRLALSERDSAEEQAARHLLQVRLTSWAPRRTAGPANAWRSQCQGTVNHNVCYAQGFLCFVMVRTPFKPSASHVESQGEAKSRRGRISRLSVGCFALALSAQARSSSLCPDLQANKTAELLQLCFVQEEEPKARQEARLIAMKERAEVAASLAEAQAMQSMAEQPGSQMDQLTEEIARIKRAEQVSACQESVPRGPGGVVQKSLTSRCQASQCAPHQ